MMHADNTRPDISPPQIDPEEIEALMSPQARLEATRAALQLWVDHTYHPERLTAAETDAANEASSGTPDASEPAWLGLMVDALSDVPVASVAVRYLRRWWARHPWRATAQFAGAAGTELLQPTAARHPWLLLGAAAVGGALLTRARPWRWVSGSALLASLLPPISLASILSTATALMSTLNPGGSGDAPQGNAADAPGFEDTLPAEPDPHDHRIAEHA